MDEACASPCQSELAAYAYFAMHDSLRNLPKESMPTCPKCGSDKAARNLYGQPNFENAELMQDVKNGKVILGGCVVAPGLSPNKQCRICTQRLMDPGTETVFGTLHPRDTRKV